MTDQTNKPASLGAQVLLLTQEFGQFKTNFAQFQSEIREWMHQKQGAWRGVWPVVASVGGILWFILNLQINQTTSPIRETSARALSMAETNTMALSKIAETLPAIMQQNAASLQDRNDQRAAQAKFVETQTHILQTQARESAERLANEREVETQIDAMSQLLSVQFANQQRLNADHQNALHDMGAKVPVAPNGPFYFPNISNRNHRKQP